MRLSRPLLILAVVGTLVVAQGCPGRGEPSDSDEVVLKTYEVPKGFDTREVQNLLEGALREDADDSVGSVTIHPNGTLVVTAPASAQRGVADLLDGLARGGPPAPPPAPSPLAIRYWALLARPIEIAGEADKVRIDSRMLRGASIRPVLDRIVEVDGPMEFALLEQVRLVSVEGTEWSSMRGGRLQVRQRVVDTRAGVTVAEIKINMWGNRGVRHDSETRVRLDPGRVIVLSQSAYDSDLSPPEGWRGSDMVQLYYVISAE